MEKFVAVRLPEFHIPLFFRAYIFHEGRILSYIDLLLLG